MSEKDWESVWGQLFKSNVHLDSALSKLSKASKSQFAEIIPAILLKPCSLAEREGVGLPLHEPWTLSMEEKGRWKPARILYSRLSERRRQGEPGKNFISGFEGVSSDFPPEMVEVWRHQWGENTQRTLVKLLSGPAPLTLRAQVNIGSAELLRQLKEGAWLPVRAAVSEWAPLAVRLEGYAAVLNTELYQNGFFEIQDEGSQWMAHFSLWPEAFSVALAPQPGEEIKIKAPVLPKHVDSSIRIIDACAGAGGKTLAIADALRNQGRVFAYDTIAGKLKALKKRATTAKLSNIQTLVLTEDKEAECIKNFEKTANIVLVDAPCSGWGVMRRNPDIKWRQQPEVLNRLPKIQARLLDLYSTLVLPGGRLVYGVCTFRKEETIEVIDDFLLKHPEFAKSFGGYLGPGSSDGFFMQALERRS